MKIITDAGIEIEESQIDTEYAKAIIRNMVDRVITENIFKEDALKELERIERYVSKAKARAELMASKEGGEEENWGKCLAAFKASGYTGGGVTAYLDSREKHDPMDDDPNRDRDPK